MRNRNTFWMVSLRFSSPQLSRSWALIVHGPAHFSIIYWNCSDSKCALSDVIRVFFFVEQRHCRTAFTLTKVLRIFNLRSKSATTVRCDSIISSISHTSCFCFGRHAECATNDLITCRCGWHFAQNIVNTVFEYYTVAQTQLPLSMFCQRTTISGRRTNNNQWPWLWRSRCAPSAV